MKIDKEKFEFLKIKFPVRFNQVYMYLVDRINQPVLQMMGHSASHSHYMAARGKFLAEVLNQLAVDHGLLDKMPVAYVPPPSIENNPISEPPAPIAETAPEVEKVDYKKRGRGRPPKR